jgi:hypothetical protein
MMSSLPDLLRVEHEEMEARLVGASTRLPREIVALEPLTPARRE